MQGLVEYEMYVSQGEMPISGGDYEQGSGAVPVYQSKIAFIGKIGS